MLSEPGWLIATSKDRIMSTTKPESLKIPVLNKTDYPTWKVKMILYLEAADPHFIDMITDVPHVPKKLVPKEGTTPEHSVDKTRGEMTREERLEVFKDSKVKSILHNSLDSVMSNRVITCKTFKEIWDTRDGRKNRSEWIPDRFEPNGFYRTRYFGFGFGIRFYF